MMSEDNSSDGLYKTRPVFANVTNRAGKRWVSSILGNSTVKSGGKCTGNVDNKEEGSYFKNQVCLGVENLEKENFLTKGVVNDQERGKRVCVSPHTCSEINSLKGNVISRISKIPTETKDPNSLDGSFHLGRGNAVTQSAVEVGDAFTNKCVPTISIPTSSCSIERLDVEGKYHEVERAGSEVAQSSSLHEHLHASICTNDGTDLSVDNMDSCKCGSIECSRLPESQESSTLGLDRCIGLKGSGVDLIKDCSCSFCTKVAYIWSDLHYQDIKGQIAALKKSHKEASILVQRCSRNKGIDKHGQGSSNKFSKLESDLIGQWRSLFLHMEDKFDHESSQLEAKLLALKDLRENCKTELELINGMPLEKQ